MPLWIFKKDATKEDIKLAVEQIKEHIDMKLKDLPGVLVSVKEQIEKAKAEVIAKIAALEAALGDVDLSPEAEAALESLKATAQGIDDIVPDAPSPTP